MKKTILLALLILPTKMSYGQDTAAINTTWTVYASDTSLTYQQIVQICDSQFAAAGIPDTAESGQGGNNDSVTDEDGSPYYSYSLWKNFWATRLDVASGKPHNFTADAITRLTSGTTSSNCAGASGLQSSTPAIPHVAGWQFIGPQNITDAPGPYPEGWDSYLGIANGNSLEEHIGQVNNLVINLANPAEIYATDAWGGLWKTTNASTTSPAATTWACLSDNLPSISGIGLTDLYVDFSTTPHTLYCLVNVPFGRCLIFNSVYINPTTIGMFYSPDDGAHFYEMNIPGLPDPISDPITAVQYWPGNNNPGATGKYMFITTQFQVYRVDITNPASIPAPTTLVDMTTILPPIPSEQALRFRDFTSISFLPADPTVMYVTTESNNGQYDFRNTTAGLYRIANCNCTSCSPFTPVGMTFGTQDYLNSNGNFMTRLAYDTWYASSGWSWGGLTTPNAQCIPAPATGATGPVSSIETLIGGSYLDNFTYNTSFTLVLPPNTEVDVVIKDVIKSNEFTTDWGTTTTPTAGEYTPDYAVGYGRTASGGRVTLGHYKNDGTTTITVNVTGAEGVVATGHFVDRIEFGAYALPGYTGTDPIILDNVVVEQPYETGVMLSNQQPATGRYIYCSTNQGNEYIQDLGSGTYTYNPSPLSTTFIGFSAVSPYLIYGYNNQSSFGTILQQYNATTNMVSSDGSAQSALHPDARCLVAIPNSSVSATYDNLYIGHDGGVSVGQWGGPWQSLNGTGMKTGWAFDIGSSIHTGEVGIACTDNGLLFGNNQQNCNNWQFYYIGDGGQAKYGKRYLTRNVRFQGWSSGGGFVNLNTAYTGGLPAFYTYPNLDQSFVSSLSMGVQLPPLGKLVTTYKNEYVGSGTNGNNIYDVGISYGSGTTADPYALQWNSLTTDPSFIPNLPSYTVTAAVQALAPDLYDPTFIAAYMHQVSWDPGYFAICTTATATTPLWTIVDNHTWLPYGTNAESLISLAVDPRSPSSEKRLWAGASGYGTAGVYRVFQGIYSGGSITWSDISSGMPEGPVNALAYDEQSHYLFAGTDQGIYALNVDSSNGWECYSLKLPNSFVTGLDINRCTGKLYASTYGRGAYECDLPPDWNWNGTSTADGALGMADSCDIDSIHGTITNPTFWTQDVDEMRTIYIGPGKALVMQNCTVNMGRNKNIIVDVGGSLVVQGATITNSCGIMWGTISVRGNPAVVQDFAHRNEPITTSSVPYSATQGFVDLLPYSGVSPTRYPVIENSYLGIAAMGIYYDGTDICDYEEGYEGGLVYANNAQFHNCASGAFFEPYPLFGEESSFTGCRFYSDDTLQNSFFTDNTTGTPRPYGMEIGIYNNGTYGMSLNTDTFETINNTAVSFAPDEDLRGVGYNGYNSSAGFIACVFNHLERGILSTHTFSGNDFIEGNTFNYCWRDVSIDGSNDLVCYNNTLYTSSTGFAGGALSQPVGIIATTSGFHINQNTVSTGYGAYANDDGLEVTGVAGNTLYNNTVNGCQVGIDAYLGPYGLCQLKCNTLNGTIYGIRTWLAASAGAVPSDEGNCAQPTANAFNVGSHMQIQNYINYPFTSTPLYVYTFDNSPYELNSAQIYNVIANNCSGDDCSNFSSCCPIEPAMFYRIGSSNGGSVRISVADAKAGLEAVDSEISLVQATLSAGNRNSLYVTINNSNIPVSRVYDSLMNAGPYLSDSILLAVINRKEPLPSIEIESIMINNSALSMPVVSDLSTEYPSVAIDPNFMAAQAKESQRQQLEDSLAGLYQEQFEYVSALQTHYDSMLKFDAAGKLMADHGQYEMAFGYYLRDSNYTAARRMVNKITDSSLNTLMALTLSYNEQGISTDSVSSADSATIATMSLDRTTHAGEMAYIWYTHAYSLKFYEYFPNDTGGSPGGRRSQPPQEQNQNNSTGQNNSSITIYPNPAQDQVTMTINNGKWGEGSTLMVMDMYGRKMLNSALPDNNSITVNTQPWATGLYLFTVRLGDGKQYTYKVVVRKD